MGMPGVGKGTQAALLKDALEVPHVSTGDILREAVREGSSLGRKVRGLLDAGRLVPDEMMGELIAQRLGQGDARGGFVLDGFPRTEPQVGILDRVLERVGTDACIMWRQKASDVVFPESTETLKRDLDQGTRRLKGYHYQIVLRELQTLCGHRDRLQVWTRLAKDAAGA